MEELDDPVVSTFPDITKGGGRGGQNSKPPVLQIDMDLEWDEMMISPFDGDEEIDQSVLMTGTDIPPTLVNIR